MDSRNTEEQRILNAIKSGLTLIGTVIPVSQKMPLKLRDKVLYISSPITTGKRMYHLMERNSYSQIKQIPKNTLYEKIMQPNIKDSVMFSKKIRNKGYKLLIVPGYFVAEGWTQDHYLDLWTKVIKDFSHSVSFNKGWEYSNGCVKEFLIAMESGKELLNYELKPLNTETALAQIKKAIEVIEAKHIVPDTLYSLVRKIELAHTRPL